MEKQTKQYTDDETSAALMLLFLAGCPEDQPEKESSPDTIPRIENNESPGPSDSTDDLIIDESTIIKEEEKTTEGEDETITPPPRKEDKPASPELVEFLATCTMDSLIGRMTNVALRKVDTNSTKGHDESNLRQRLEEFINEEEVHGTKYHASMKRVYASAAERSANQQVSRDKNNTASRLSRIRLRNAEQNLKIEAHNLDEANTAGRMKKAVLLNYVHVLHEALKLKPMDFDRPVKEILMEYGTDWKKLKKTAESNK